MAGANEGYSIAGGKMGKGFFEGAGKGGELCAGSNAQDGFAKAEDAVGGGFKGLRNRIVQIAGDNDLNGMVREKRGGQAIGGGEQAILRSNLGEGFER
ncbi:MAG TPA: hypothetical protein VE263_22595, partial [Candidatus Angelobacter sp.]|nr:hypothetical protein [Candidatus Angelobacter sp.]